MKTKVFAYKGYVGISSGPKAEGIIASAGGSNLGYIVDADKVEVSAEALDLLKKIPRGSGDLGELEIYQAGEQKIFGWLGGPFKVIHPGNDNLEMGWDYYPSILKTTEGVETPELFKTFIDNL